MSCLLNTFLAEFQYLLYHISTIADRILDGCTIDAYNQICSTSKLNIKTAQTYRTRVAEPAVPL